MTKNYKHLLYFLQHNERRTIKFILSLGYLETVHEAFLSEGGEQCINIIRQGILETVEALKTEAGRRSLEQAYR